MAVLDAPSATLQVTVVAPVLKLDPLVPPDECVGVPMVPGQLSFAVGEVYVTVAAQVLVITFAVAFAGQVMVGS